MANPAKKLVIYYSLDGMTATLAKTIADTIGADVLELRPKKPIPQAAGFVKKLVLGGMQVLLKRQPELLPLEQNPADYDLIVMGTPVWVGHLSAPFRTFLATTRLQQKQIALFCCYLGNAGKALDNMKQALSGNTIVGETGFGRRDQANAAKAAAWAQKVMAEASR